MRFQAGDRSRALGVLGLVVGATLVALAIGEVTARLTWTPPERPVHAPLPAGLRELHDAFELTSPNVQGAYNGAFYRSNAAGFRGRDYQRQKPPGVVRIVIGGDSVTMGSGVREEEAYPALLEQALNQRGGTTRYEVLNLGLIGIDIREVMARIASLGLPYDPDLIVYGCTLNDIKGPAYRKSIRPGSQFERRIRYARFRDSRSYLLRALWPRWQSLRDLLLPRPGSYLYEVRDNYLHNPRAWSDFTSGLDRLAEVAAARHVPAIVFVHTSLEYLNVFHPYRGIYDRIATAGAERGLRTIQSFSTLRGHEEASLWVAPDDAHPNALAHRLLARALLDGLDRLPLPAPDPRR